MMMMIGEYKWGGAYQTQLHACDSSSTGRLVTRRLYGATQINLPTYMARAYLLSIRGAVKKFCNLL